MLAKKASGPFAGGYKPELDESPELDSTRANFYQSQIGILRWYVELGRIDIITEVSMLSTYLFSPREGHLEAVFHVFAYLVLHHNARVVFDPTYPAVDMGTFIKTDWKSMYGDVKEMIPSDAPIPRGKEVDLRLFVDSDLINYSHSRNPPCAPARTHERTNESKRPESHPTKACARARVRCLNTEPNYYYCPITLLMS
jgi:hypothetical protein